jgi:biopolymer transport protein ExbD
MDEKEIGYINAVPLVDVMLVLLTIALTTATFVKQGSLSVDLPSAKAQTREAPKTIRISITKDRTYFVNDKQVTLETIKSQLVSFNRESLCEIYADKTVMVEDLTQMMSLLGESGFSKIVVKTKTAV